MENKNSNLSYYFRIVAGVYVCYIGVKLIMGFFNGESEMNPVILWVSSILFLAAGLYFVISSVRILIGNYASSSQVNSAAQSAEDPEETVENEIAVEETAAEENRTGDSVLEEQEKWQDM